MRLSVVLLIAALAGILGGGALIGLPALGACLIFDSVCVGVWALFHDDGRAAPSVHEVPQELKSFLDRVRAAS